MKPNRQAVWWLLGLVGFFALIWLFSAILAPFVIGIAVAYLLDPVCGRLQRLGMSRTLATTFVTLLFVIAFVLLLGLLIPLLVSEVARFLGQLPSYLELVRVYLEEAGEALQTQVDPIVLDTLREVATVAQERLGEWAAQLARDILTGGVALFHLVSLLIISPIVAFYLLRDWHKLLAQADGLLPPAYARTIRALVREVDRTLSGFLRGVGVVCLTLAVFYATTLTLAGLNFGLVIGLLAGLISFIPFVGAILGFIASVGMAFLQFDSYLMIGLIASIFLVGQFLEGYILHPRLVGRRVGLHPVWVIFAFLGGATLLGFVGVLISVPLAAVIGVGVRFAVAHYRRRVLRAPASRSSPASTESPAGTEEEEPEFP